jgi:hypothetical protein
LLVALCRKLPPDLLGRAQRTACIELRGPRGKPFARARLASTRQIARLHLRRVRFERGGVGTPIGGVARACRGERPPGVTQFARELQTQRAAARGDFGNGALRLRLARRALPGQPQRQREFDFPLRQPPAAAELVVQCRN